MRKDVNYIIKWGKDKNLNPWQESKPITKLQGDLVSYLIY